MIKNTLRNKKGQGLVEYALIIGLVAIALVATFTTFRTQITTAFTSLGNTVAGW